MSLHATKHAVVELSLADYDGQVNTSTQMISTAGQRSTARCAQLADDIGKTMAHDVGEVIRKATSDKLPANGSGEATTPSA